MIRACHVCVSFNLIRRKNCKHRWMGAKHTTMWNRKSSPHRYSIVCALCTVFAVAARFICFEAQKIFKLQILMKWLETMEYLTAHNKIMLQHKYLIPWKLLSSLSFSVFEFTISHSHFMSMCGNNTINQKFQTKHLFSWNIYQRSCSLSFFLLPSNEIFQFYLWID